VRFADPHRLHLKDLGTNHTEMVLHLNNSARALPFVTPGENGVFSMPLDMLWSQGLSTVSIFWRLGLKPWTLVDTFCDTILGNKNLIELLNRDHFNVAVVDLIYNECGLALAGHLGVPSVGYWAFSLTSGEADLTAASTPPSHVPAFMSALSDQMTFSERTVNTFWKMGSLALMWSHCLRCDWTIQKHLPNSPRSWNLLANLNGALINTNYALDYPRLQPETFVNVGGMQIRKSPNPLPEVLLVAFS
jgi:hypothetical protein